MITFEEVRIASPKNVTSAAATASWTAVHGRAAELEQELQYTKENLQITIEGQATTNEELKSSNEELESTNEELQSTNDELETSKEELQSLNEEHFNVFLMFGRWFCGTRTHHCQQSSLVEKHIAF